MNIQIHIDSNVSAGDMDQARISSYISRELLPFDSEIGRLIVHLSTDSRHNEGSNDRLCTIEALLDTKHPFAVRNYADSDELAVKGAAAKLKISISNKLRHYRYLQS